MSSVEHLLPKQWLHVPKYSRAVKDSQLQMYIGTSLLASEVTERCDRKCERGGSSLLAQRIF